MNSQGSRGFCWGLLVSGLLPLLVAPRVPAEEAGLPDKIEFNRDIRPLLSDKCFTCHGPDANTREADLRLDVRENAVSDRGGYQVLAPGKAAESVLLARITSEEESERMPPSATGKSFTPREIDLLKLWIAQGAEYQRHWSLIPPQRPDVPAVRDASWPRNAIDHFVLAPLEQRGWSPSPDADRRTLIRRLSFDLLGLPPTPEELDAFLADTSPGAYERLVDRLLASRHFGERMAVYWLDVVRYADSGGYHSDNERSVWPFRDYVIRAFNENLPFDRFTIEQLAGDLLPNATPQQKIASGYNRLLQTTEEGGAQPKEYTVKYQSDRVRNTAAAWLGITMGCCECHNHKFDPFTMKDFYSLAAFFADVQEKPVGRQDQIGLPTPEQEEQLAALERQLAPLRDEFARPRPDLAESQALWEAKTLAALVTTSFSLASLTEVAGLPDAIILALVAPPEQRTPEQLAALDRQFHAVASELAPLRAQIADFEGQIHRLREAFPQTLISISVAPRTVRILPRGNWQDDSGEIVEPATPASLPAAEIPDRQQARLALARWMVSPENPLPSRVFVNRLWKMLFGQGLVRSPADFGTQGSWPTHAALLDWLTVEFRDSGWNVKHTIKQIVMSRAYQQSSSASPELRQRDPNNEWLARQGCFRLDAEFVRDNALAVSGLLSDTVGGPSVRPYQPAGYWRYLNFPQREWENEKGANLYRRGLYTHWQRSFLHPSLLAFDATTREECTAERPRSNTPLQALALLNDPTYVEAARALAARIIERGGATAAERIQYAFRQVLARAANDQELEVLNRLQAKHREQYGQQADQATQLLSVGQAKNPDNVDPAELAGWTAVARVVLNLYETVTRF